jgi:hypothetical protein
LAGGRLVNVAQLKKQLARDLKRSPKKAAVLGLLALVAVYFWAPLISGMFRGEKPKGKNSAPPAAALPSPVPTAAPAASPAPQYPWQQLAEAIQEDARMRTAELDIAARTPFGLAVSEQEPDDAAAENAAEWATSEKLGLTLSATITGGRRRVALINGRPYVEGELVVAADDAAWKIVRITAGRVVLQRGSVRLELTSPEAELAAAGETRS